MRKLIAILCALGVAVLSAGCSGGSIYSNYRDIAELMIVQTLGFDSMPDGGVTVSVSAEGSSGAGSEDGSKKPERLSASAASLTEAQDELQHYSGGLQLFFGHTAYFLLGAQVLSSDTTQFFDCIERDTAFRLSIPVFAVSSGSTSELILGAGDEERDATKLMHAAAPSRSCDLFHNELGKRRRSVSRRAEQRPLGTVHHGGDRAVDHHLLRQ